MNLVWTEFFRENTSMWFLAYDPKKRQEVLKKYSKDPPRSLLIRHKIFEE
jgi:hypothetical protein